MAQARICDRCGEVYAKNTHFANFDTNKSGTVKGVVVMFKEASSGDQYAPKNAYMDLCDGCCKSITEFLLNPKAEVKLPPNSSTRGY